MELIKQNAGESPIKYDYAKSDSIFLSKDKIHQKVNEKFGNKQEVLDFSTDKVVEKSKKIVDFNDKYDLNTISEADLMKLPGIGSKVAKNILDYRKEKGRFEDLNQLLEIKGIGERKFNELKKFLIIK